MCTSSYLAVSQPIMEVRTVALGWFDDSNTSAEKNNHWTRLILGKAGA